MPPKQRRQLLNLARKHGPKVAAEQRVRDAEQQQGVDRVERAGVRVVEVGQRELDLVEDDQQDGVDDVHARARGGADQREDQDDRRQQVEHVAEVPVRLVARGTEDAAPGQVELDEQPNDEKRDHGDPNQP